MRRYLFELKEGIMRPSPLWHAITCLRRLVREYPEITALYRLLLGPSKL